MTPAVCEAVISSNGWVLGPAKRRCKPALPRLTVPGKYGWLATHVLHAALGECILTRFSMHSCVEAKEGGIADMVINL